MNIVYVANSKIPSSQANSIHVMKMCQAFAENGHRINLLVPDYDGTSTESTLQNLFDNYSVKQVFGISRIKIRFNKGGIYLFGFLASFYYLKKQPDVVYGRSLVGCFFAALFGFKTIFEMHSLPEYGAGLSNKLNSWMLKFLLLSRQLEKLVVISNGLRTGVLENFHNISSSNIIVAHDGADRCFGPTYYPICEKPVIGYIGNLYTGKGIELIVELAKILPKYDFKILGGQPAEIEFWKSKSASNIFYLGHKSPKEAEKFRFECDILLAPYQKIVRGAGKENIASWMSPLKLFEYMAAGKPIVCSDLPVLREVLENEVNALLCDPDKPSIWAESIRRLVDSLELREKLGSAARSKLEEQYTWLIRAQNVLQ